MKTKKKILLVEDQALIAMEEKMTLEKYGYQVTTKYSGEDAVEYMNENTDIDLILMDIDLGSGIDSTEAAEKILEKHDLPLVFLSSHTEREVVEKTEGITSYGYIVKASGETVLIASVKMAFRLFESKQETQEHAARSEAIVRALPDLMFVIDKDGYYKEVHSPDTSLLPIPADEVIGKSIDLVFGKEEADRHRQYFKKCLETEKNQTYDYKLDIEGSKHYFEAEITKFDDKHILAIVHDITDRKEAKLKIDDLNSLLMAIRNVNQVIVQEDDLTEIMQKACQALLDTRQYLNIEVALLDENKAKIYPIANAGEHGLREWCVSENNLSEATKCVREVIKSKQVFIIDKPEEYCAECTFVDEDTLHKTVMVPMLKNEQLVGILTASMIPGHDISKEEIDLLQEVADDLAFAREKVKAEDELRMSEEKYHHLISNLSEGLIRVDNHDRILFVNQALCNIFGYTEDELIGKIGYETLIFEEDQIIIKEKNKARLKIPFERYEIRGRKKSGEIIWLSISGSAVKNQEGHVIGSVGLLTDITERKQIEEALRESDNRFKSLLSLVPDMISIHDADMNILYSNWRGFADVTERKRQINAKCYKTYRDLDEICPDCIAGSVIETKKSLRVEAELPDGRWFDINAIPLLDDKNNVSLFMEWVRDITDHKKTEQMLRKRLHYEKIVSKVSALTIEAEDLDDFLKQSVTHIGASVGLSYCYIFEYNRQSEILNNIVEWHDPKVSAQIDKLQKISVSEVKWWHETLKDGENICFSDIETVTDENAREILRAQGILSILVVPLFVDNQYYGYIGLKECKYNRAWPEEDVELLTSVARIISGAIERKRAVDKLDEEHKRLAYIMEVTDTHFNILDSDYNIHYIDSAWQKFYGNPQGKKCYQYFMDADAPCAGCGVKQSLETQNIVVYDMFLRKENRFIQVHTIPFQDKNGKWLIAEFNIDITERKQAEEKLKISEDRYNRAISGTGAGLWDWDMIKNTVYFSKQWKKMLGYEDHEIPDDFSGWRNLWHPDDADFIEQKVKDYLEGKTKTYEVEHRLLAKNGTWRWILTRGDIEKDSSGQPVRWAGTNIDITELKQAEEALRESEEKFRSLIESSNDGICLQDMQGEIIFANKRKLGLLGFDNDKQLVGSNVFDLLLDTEKQRFREMMPILIEKGFLTDIETEVIKQDGSTLPVNLNFSLIKDEHGNPQYVMDTMRDITESKQMQLKQETLFKISKALDRTYDLTELCDEIRKHLGKVMDTTNFYVALYDEETDTISLAYDVHEKDDFKSFPAGKTLTKYLIESARPLLVKRPELDKMTQAGTIEAVGTACKIWMGVPLIVDRKVIGVIALQSYDDPDLYSKEDIDILTFVSEHIAFAVIRTQAKEQIKKELNEKKMLLKEVLHRTKNNMQVISSMLKMQARHIDDERLMEYYREIINRINSMARVHQLLYEGKDLSVISMKQFISDVTYSLRRSYWEEGTNIELVFDLRDIFVTLDAAIPLSLVLTELVSNAFKHAFPNGGEGIIEIKLKQDEAQNIFLQIADNGVGLASDIDLHKTESMGLQLVFSLVEYQLKGEIDYSSEDGLSWHIVFRHDLSKVRV